MFILFLALSFSQRFNPAAIRRRPTIRSRKDTIMCTFCQQIVNLVDDLLEDDKVEEEITEKVVEFCQYIPSPYSSLCAAYAENGVSLVISYLEEGFDSLKICTLIGVCEGKAADANAKPMKPLIERQTKVLLSHVQKLNGFIDCTLCLEIASFLARQLVSDNVRSHVTNIVINTVCTRIPDEYNAICKDFVTSGIPNLFQYMKDYMVDNDICSSLGFCATPQLPKTRTYRPHQHNKYVPVNPIDLPENYVTELGTDMCSKIYGYIKQLLKDGVSESQIKSRLIQLCPSFSSPYNDLCDELVQNYGNTLFVWIQGGVSKKDVCTKVGLC